MEILEKSGKTQGILRFLPAISLGNSAQWRIWGGGPGVRTPPKFPIYFNIKLLIHVQGPIIKSGRTPPITEVQIRPWKYFAMSVSQLRARFIRGIRYSAIKILRTKMSATDITAGL